VELGRAFVRAAVLLGAVAEVHRTVLGADEFLVRDQIARCLAFEGDAARCLEEAGGLVFVLGGAAISAVFEGRHFRSRRR